MLSCGFSLILLMITFWGCGSSLTVAEKERLAMEVQEAVERSSFRFEAT